MKRLGFILAASAIAFSFSIVRADDEYTYSKLFEEGKVWNIANEWFDIEARDSFFEYIQVSFNREWNDGEHLLTELNCIRQQDNSSYTADFLEEDKVIYGLNYNISRRIIDFNLIKGDKVPIEDCDHIGEIIDYNYIVEDEIIDIRGVKRRILSIASEEGGVPFTYWVEGIGAIDDFIMHNYQIPLCPRYIKSRRIASCYLNGECIFEYGDLEDYIAKNGVGSIEAETPQNSEVEYYNLQGVRVSNPDNGIFIVRQGSKTYKVMK